MDSPNRAEFFVGLQPGGKYDGIVGIYRHNISTDHIGIFDKELVDKLPASVKWIAHNGAGYDQIDVAACKARGTHDQIIGYLTMLTFMWPQESSSLTRQEQSTTRLRPPLSTS